MLHVLRQSSRHWMFWPAVGLLAMSLGYMLLLGENGYLNYRTVAAEKEQLEEKIAEYERQKKDLQQKLKILSDKEKALETFAREFLLFPEKVAILKFQKEDESPARKQDREQDHSWLQRAYVIFASLAIFSITYLFWRKEKIRRTPEKSEA